MCVSVCGPCAGSRRGPRDVRVRATGVLRALRLRALPLLVRRTLLLPLWRVLFGVLLPAVLAASSLLPRLRIPALLLRPPLLARRSPALAPLKGWAPGVICGTPGA